MEQIPGPSVFHWLAALAAPVKDGKSLEAQVKLLKVRVAPSITDPAAPPQALPRLNAPTASTSRSPSYRHHIVIASQSHLNRISTYLNRI